MRRQGRVCMTDLPNGMRQAALTPDALVGSHERRRTGALAPIRVTIDGAAARLRLPERPARAHSARPWRYDARNAARSERVPGVISPSPDVTKRLDTGCWR
ncbi:hypothetical protein HEK616_62380 [Streptomyces nigrescens]|uniref:Transposase n=1 Tax=Streptomyces nigrescens TaxID=1920 RepID=A0ABM8A2E8_STRNI|nr:hypothetical protein HEK616_62380 [Streptomyces nigrescens]